MELRIVLINCILNVPILRNASEATHSDFGRFMRRRPVRLAQLVQHDNRQQQSNRKSDPADRPDRVCHFAPNNVPGEFRSVICRKWPAASRFSVLGKRIFWKLQIIPLHNMIADRIWAIKCGPA